MKISKLLVLTALWLGIASSAKAEVPEGKWSMPEPQGLEFTTFSDEYDDESGEPKRFYLYNPGAKMFFASGNSWNTCASVRTFGYPFWVDVATEEDAPEGSYELWNYVNNADRTDVTGNHNLFTDDGGSTWVDHASQGNYSWTFEIVGNYVRFQNVALIADLPDYEGKYIGWTGDYAGDKNSSVLRMIAPDTEGTCIDWQAVTVESYEAFVASDAYTKYTDGVECFFQAQKLYALLVEGEEIGAAIADQLAIYNNTASTKDELTAAVTAAQAAIDKRKQELVEGEYANATVEKPVVVNDKFLKNYDFKGDDLTTGWSGTAFGSYGPKENAEHYNKTYDTYQDVNGGLLPGVYAVGVKAFYRAGNAQPAWDNYKEGNAKSKYAKLYAKVGGVEREAAIVSPCTAMLTEYSGPGSTSQCEDTDEETGEVTTYIIPNNMEAGEYYMHTLNLYDNKVLIAVNAETDTLRLGVRKSSTIDGDWSLFDDFSLTYYGAAADACQLYLAEAMKNFGEVAIEDDALYTEAYLTAYQNLLTSTPSASSLAEVNQYLDNIDAAYNNLQKNIELWKKYVQTANAYFEKYSTNDEYSFCESVGELTDYVEQDVKGDLDEGTGFTTITEEHSLTNDQLQEELDYLEALATRIETEAKEGIKVGDDVTRFLKNANFEECNVNTGTGEAPGWTVKKDVGNVTAGPLGKDNYDLMVSALGEMNYCFESWHSHDFDVYQEVTNAPEGVYVIEAQGFVRCENSGYNRPDEVDPSIIPVHLYMNNSTDVFPSVYSETRPINPETGEEYQYTTVESWTIETQGGYDYPNSMGGAAQCFGWGMYKMSTFGLVKAGDVMRIGVKGKMKTDDTENWWCIWDNFKLTYQGYEVEYVQPALDKALEQISTDKAMGKTIYEQAVALNAKAAEAKASGDGKTMFRMLAEITDVAASITESVAVFAELETALEDDTNGLNAKIWASDNDAAKAEATALYNEIKAGVENHQYEDADVAGLLEQIAKMITKLGIPGDASNATDDNPVDMTSVIINPTYDEGVSGWSGTAASWSGDGFNAEIFGKNFDYYQEIVGLPAGTYQLGVQGFYRAGSAAADYKAYQENSDSLNHAFIYAMTALEGDTVTFSKPMARLAAEASEDNVGSDGYVTVVEADDEAGTPGLAVANNMTTASYEFDAGKYLNEGVIFKLPEGATLRIGLKKTTDLTDNWTIWDNWTLTYFGNASAKTVDGDPSGIENVNGQNAIQVEYFTLDGRKATYAQKGIMIQKVTFSNGATLIKKIRK